VAYYVPLGLRGLILSIGTFLIGVLGGLVYRVASRRRATSGSVVIGPPLTVMLPD
jgi:hypothetical protein